MGIYIAQAVTALSVTLNTKIHVYFLVTQAALFQHLRSSTCKKISINFCIKFTIYMYIKYINYDSYKNLFFIFLLFNAVTAKLDRKDLPLPPSPPQKKKRKKLVNFFQREVFGHKTTCFQFRLIQHI